MSSIMLGVVLYGPLIIGVVGLLLAYALTFFVSTEAGDEEV